MHKTLMIALVVLVCGIGVLTIAQVWGFGPGWDTYTKAVVTMGILVLMAAFGMVIKADFGQHKKLKDENYLD